MVGTRQIARVSISQYHLQGSWLDISLERRKRPRGGSSSAPSEYRISNKECRTSKYVGEGADCVFYCQLGRCFDIPDFNLRNSLFKILRFLRFAMISGHHAGNGVAFMVFTARSGGLP